jgi:hypothetical protein
MLMRRATSCTLRCKIARHLLSLSLVLIDGGDHLGKEGGGRLL